VFSGRTAPVEGIERIAGPCIATLPVRVDVRTTKGGLDGVVQEINGVLRRHLENDAVSLREIGALAEVESEGKTGGLFDSIVVWQQMLGEDSAASSASADKGEGEGGKEKVSLVRSRDYLEFALTLEFTPAEEVVRIDARYKREVFPEEMAEVMVRQIEGLMEDVVGRVHGSVAKGVGKGDGKTVEKGLMSILVSGEESEEKKVSEDGEKVSIAAKGVKSLTATVGDIAALYPTRNALEVVTSDGKARFKVHEMTYAQLNDRLSRANRPVMLTSLDDPAAKIAEEIIASVNRDTLDGVAKSRV
jgi:hypothetical protein